MKLLLKTVIPVIIIVTTAVLIVYFLNEGETLAESDIEYFPIRDPCDLGCKERHEKLNGTCIELETNGYACREEIKLRTDEFIYTYVIPPELGEYYLIPLEIDLSIDSTAKISFHTGDSIQVTFDEKFNKGSIIIEKNQKFTTYCYETKNIHVWTFTGIAEVEGKQYIEMHMRLAKIPEGFDCTNPIHILEKS